MRRTFINTYVKNLRFFDNFLTITYFTFVFFIDNFTFTLAFVTRTSTLSVHTRSNHLHFSDHTTTSACATSLYSSLFAAFTTALLADSLSINFNLGLFTFVDFFKSTFKRVHNRFSFSGARLLLTASTTSKKSTKEITHVGSTTSAF